MPTAGTVKSRKTGRSRAYSHPKGATWFRKHGVRWRSTIGVRSAERYIENKEANELLMVNPPDEHPASPKEPVDISNMSVEDDSESVASRVCSRTRNNGALCRSSSGVGSTEKNIRTNKRVSRLPSTKPFKEHSASPKKPLGVSHASSEDDSEPVVRSRRKRRNESMTQLDTTGKDLVSQAIPSKSECDDEALIGKPPSKVRKLKTSALFPGPLDKMDIEPSVSKMVSETEEHEDHPIVIGDDGEDHVRLANLTTQESSTALGSLKKKAWGAFSGSKLVEAVESDDGQKITYCCSSPERQAGEPPGPQMLEHALTSTQTISLVDNLRQAAAERNNKAFASGTPVLRKTRSRSKSVSLMPKCVYEFSGRPPNHTRSPIDAADVGVNDEVLIPENPTQKTRRSTSALSMSESALENSQQPTRSPFEIADGCLSDEVPTVVELKHKIISLKHKINDGQMSTTDRKRAFVYDPTLELVLSMEQYIEKTYSMFHTDLDEDDCWLHPSPPSPHQNRGNEGYIQHQFRWTDGDIDYVLNVNFGIVLLLVQNRLTDEQKQGYVTQGWRVNRICGNWTCCNWHHFAMETMEMLASRRRCFGSSDPCRHSPPCLRDKIRHPSRPTQSRRPARSPPAISITGATGSTQLPNPTLPARAITNRATNHFYSNRSSPSTSMTRIESSLQLPSVHPPTSASHSKERGSLLPYSPLPTRSVFGSGSSSQPLRPLPPRSLRPTRPTRSDSSNESSPRSSSTLPPRSPPATQLASCRERSLHASNPLPTAQPTLTVNSSLHASTPPPLTTPTAANENNLKTPETSDLPDPDGSPPNASIAAKAREVLLPAAQNLKSAFRAIGLWQNE